MSGYAERITQINDNDVICGRKGLALRHPGNLAYRKLVALNKELYATCMKNEKLRISKSIVAAVREQSIGGGRFLEREDGRTSFSNDEKGEEGNPVVYVDLGDKRAIEKTSQALREGQPKLLKKLALKRQQQQVTTIQTNNALSPLAFRPYDQLTGSSTRNISPISLGSISQYDHFAPLPNKHHQASSMTPQGGGASMSQSIIPQSLAQLTQVEKDLLLLAFLQR